MVVASYSHCSMEMNGRKFKASPHITDSAFSVINRVTLISEEMGAGLTKKM